MRALIAIRLSVETDTTTSPERQLVSCTGSSSLVLI
jgi:hypothetical protein